MKNRKTVIAAAFANPVDRKLVDDYLSGLGYDLVEFSGEGVPPADLFILDVPCARRLGRQVIELKKRADVFLPAMIALGSRDPVEPWLDAGFDDNLRMPFTKAELKVNVAILLRLRQQSQQLAQKSEEKYRAIFEATSAATIVVAEDATILMASQECLRVTGYSPGELVGTKWTDYVAPDSLEELLKYHKARREHPEKAPNQYEIKLVDKAGRTRTAILSVVLVPGTGQSIVSMVDITERKRAEAERERAYEALKASEARFNSFFHNSAVGMLIWDTGDPVKYVAINHNLAALNGRRPEEHIGKTIAEVINSEVEEKTMKVVRRILQTGEHATLDSSGTAHDGRDVHYFASYFPITVDDEIRGIGGVVIDQTGRVAAEREKKKLEEQLQQAQKLESIGRLAGGVAHDFNNMLSVILGYGEIVHQELHPGDPLRKDMEAILKAARSSADLTRQLLAFSRKQTLQPEVLDLNEVVRSIEKMLRRLIGEDIALELSLSKDLSHVKVDPGQIEQVIMNLAVNARDAMPTGGKLLIETSEVELDEAYAQNHADVTPGKYVMLAMTDTGCGMDKEVLLQIFDPFFTTKEKGKGTGLGLSTVYGIVKQSGGNIWVYSEPGQGATFKIYLPVTGDQAETLAEEVAREESAGGGEHILVVEDEESLRKLLKAMLSRSGYKVTLAANGGEALLLVEEKGLKPDLVITDVVMPGMSGRELVDRLQRKQPDLMALYMSGYTDNAIIHHGALDPGTPFIQKPFTIHDIAEKVRAVLREKLPKRT